MRCPKCGFISFDNVEKCLKCRKNIAEASKAFQGSVLNVATPVFLKLTADEEEVDVAVTGFEEETVEEDFEIVDPDLDILVEEEGSTDDIELSLEGEATDEDEVPDLDELSGDLSEIEAFAEDDSEASGDDDMAAIDLGMLEETAEGEPESDMPTMKMPDELADLSDLSPAAATATEVTLEESEEPEIDLDFAGLDAAFDSDTPADSESKKETVLSLDMDEDLNFELDLGGLSIHDENK